MRDHPAPDPLRDLGDEGIAQLGKAVHPIGNPIIHSQTSGRIITRAPSGPIAAFAVRKRVIAARKPAQLAAALIAVDVIP